MILKPEDIRNLHGRIAFDVETSGGMEPHMGQLVGLGVWCEDSGVIGYVPCSCEADHIAIMQAVRTWQKGSFLVCHNIKYELKWLHLDYEWLRDYKIYDCLIAEHLLNEEYTKDLGSVEMRYLKSRTKKALLAAGAEYGGIKKIAKWPVEVAAEYCINDCRITFLIAQHQKPRLIAEKQTRVLAKHMQFIRELHRLERRGILIDHKKSEESLSKIERILAAAQVRLDEMLQPYGSPRVNIRSAPQLSKLLYETLALPKPELPESLKGTQKEKLYKSKTLTSKLLIKDIDHEVPRFILKMKALMTVRGYLEKYQTFAKPLVSARQAPDSLVYRNAEGNLVPRYGTIHSSFNDAGTVTGRLSSSNPNLQQVKASTEGIELDPEGKGIQLRPHFVARKGFKMVSIDYKQMEVIVFAILSQDPRLLQMVASGEDAHDYVAELMYGKRGNPYRKWIKGTNFGILYGLGDGGLASDLGMTVAEAASLRARYLATFPRVRPWMMEINKELEQYGFLTYWSGRRRRIPNSNDHYKGINSAVQGGCAEMLIEAIIRVADFFDKRGLGEGILAPVHDELVMEVAEEGLDETIKELQKIMSLPELLGTPLNTDAEYGDAWGEVDEVGAGDKKKAGKVQAELDRLETERLLELVEDGGEEE